ncbi:helix-turn-helix domain-containing protein [Ochrobactrum sp. C6C9]|uniref:hypothetical protein n=1 Tax=Ochrobactrum sp. C6C9 TaxID=2736662 RepID=UPI0035302B12|nr:helix-turn-helix domain-containing protein [Ochrobactrum sp. C6C9]
MTEKFERPKELAARIGWPIKRIRTLIASKQLRHHRIGGSIIIPINAIDEFLKNTEVEPCQEIKEGRALSHEREDRTFSSDTSKPAESRKTFQRAQEYCQKLKKRSKNSSATGEPKMLRKH